MNKLDFERFCINMEKRPHLFILGAGATMATIPNGDKYGRKSSVMNNLLEEIGRADILKGVKLETKSKNIESIYSELVERPECKQIVRDIEYAMFAYFSQLSLPDEPTLYDYLILALRNKDCIATFNWDPLLLQAYTRVNQITKDLPELLFLHGCVSVGICEDCGWVEPLRNKFCHKCGKPLEPTKLMYPVAKKDYDNDLFIRHNKEILLDYLKRGCLITIWGYSAPESDYIAKQFMTEAFKLGPHRLDHIEIIDIADENVIMDKWSSFAESTNYHLDIHKNLSDSLLGEFPRRSVEGYVKRYIKGWWGESKLKYQQTSTFDKLSNLFEPLIEQELYDNIQVV